MSYKKQRQEKQAKSLMMALEDAVLAMEAAGQAETEIFAYVNMILKGFIRNGQITEEYIRLAKDAMEQQQIEAKRAWDQQEDQNLRDMLAGRK